MYDFFKLVNGSPVLLVAILVGAAVESVQ